MRNVFGGAVKALLLTCLFGSVSAGAQEYPAKPVKIIVAYPPAGTTDIIARLVAQKLSESLKQQFVVENKAGASGNIGAEAVARAAPDGYTLQMGTAGNMGVNPATYTSLPFDAEKDFAPITLVAQVSNLMAINPTVPAKTVAEFIAWAKSKPKQVFFATSGAGNTPHMSGELFNLAAGTEMVAVHYKGAGPALQDLIAGQGVHLIFDNMPSVVGHTRSGALRALAVTANKRSSAVPDVPTLEEAGLKGYSVTSWFGLFAPAKTPAEIVKKLHAATVAAMTGPGMKEKMEEMGAEPVLNTPEEFAARVSSDIKTWREVAVKANIKFD